MDISNPIDFKAVEDARMLDDLHITPKIITNRNFCRFEEAVQLEVAETTECGREHSLIPDAAVSWIAMKDAARKDGETLYIVSAFRSIARQTEIIRDKLSRGERIEEILTVCAPPGYSEHHTGRAVDLSTIGSESLSEEFEKTSAYRWLCKNAVEFRFALSYPRGNSAGYQFEPWHWCFNAE